ncbi:N-acetylmuramoyl-L-alanine amidase [Brevibacillus sp. AG162]|uniref:spore cortex-lytic enzyme n=1 Tax=Brevibacillus sp. AG162 TaxID=2572910 RepID=UPI001151EE61|nr:spore cortex-lytic enzyme [Brevibacillus sp. AG162]TQK74428.1 N-acetylmuramoyl-L-alanine amidase [Brevibacillus sp. AG162]
MWWSKKAVTTLLAAFMAVAFIFSADSLAATQIQRGSVNGDVWDLQYRLQMLGYYNGKMDGIYGANTTKAVRQFQKAYGLRIDGITGPNTWRVLKKVSVNKAEMQMLAQLVYSEARGEPYKGQVAVAAVALNRIQSKNFPNTLAGVIFEPLAFTAVDDGQFWMTPNKTAYQAAWDAVRGWDPTNNSLYYFNPVTATSKWIWSRTHVKKIGKHIFAI